jgi:tryptophan-rich sensory protein
VSGFTPAAERAAAAESSPVALAAIAAGASPREVARLDKSEVGKYVAATAGQVAILAGLFALVDWRTTPKPWAVGVGFALLGFRSRYFSLLDRRRPRTTVRPPPVKRPRWAPGKRVALVAWLAVTVLRAVACALLFAARPEGSRRLVQWPLLSLAGHLAIGDTWNSITNVERRLGVSVVACVAVALSVYGTAWQFWLVDKAAGLCLLPSAVWLSVACALSTEIWRLNHPPGRPDLREPFGPQTTDGKAGRWGADYSALGLVTVPVKAIAGACGRFFLPSWYGR